VTITRGSVPVGFALESLRAGESLELAKLIGAATAARIAAVAALDELRMPTDASALAVTVAICTRDRTALLERCLSSLFESIRGSRAQPGLIEVVVVDNAPTDDGTRDLVASSFPAAAYVREAKPGLNFARNRALEEARGDLVAFLDDDVVVDEGWLSGLVDAWQFDPAADLITGQVLPLELETPAQIAFERRGGFRRGFDRLHCVSGAGLDPCRIDVLGTGANMVVSRKAALELGGFDTALDAGAYLPGGGDLDMFYRVVRAGLRAVYEPRMLVRHRHRRDLESLGRQYRDSFGKAYMAFVTKSWRKDRPMRARWVRTVIVWFGTQFVHLFTRVRGPRARPFRMVVLETWGGCVGLTGSYRRAQRRARAVAVP
jgi:glycosyltransferase involved in cell wall biosynthesis